MAFVTYFAVFLLTLLPPCLGHADLTIVVNRIEALERKDLEQLARIDHLEQQVMISSNNLHHMSSSHDILQKEHATTLQKLALQEDKITSLQKDLAHQKSKADSSEQKAQMLESKVQKMDSKIEKLNRLTASCKHRFQKYLHEIKATKSEELKKTVKQVNNRGNDDADSLKLPYDDTSSNEHDSQQSDKDELLMASAPVDNFKTKLNRTHGVLQNLSERRDGEEIHSKESTHLKNTGIKSSNNFELRAITNTVAFHAVISPHDIKHLGTNANIRFDEILLNEGGGYHNQHGLFITPKPGFYLLSVTITTNHDSPFYAEIRKNGQRLVAIAGDGRPGYYDQGSVTFVAKLNTADEVWVSHISPADGSIGGNGYSSFAGILIAQF